jgi:hypothetical protein
METETDRLLKKFEGAESWTGRKENIREREKERDRERDREREGGREEGREGERHIKTGRQKGTKRQRENKDYKLLSY